MHMDLYFPCLHSSVGLHCVQDFGRLWCSHLGINSQCIHWYFFPCLHFSIGSGIFCFVCGCSVVAGASPRSAGTSLITAVGRRRCSLLMLFITDSGKPHSLHCLLPWVQNFVGLHCLHSSFRLPCCSHILLPHPGHSLHRPKIFPCSLHLGVHSLHIRFPCLHGLCSSMLGFFFLPIIRRGAVTSDNMYTSCYWTIQ